MGNMKWKIDTFLCTFEECEMLTDNKFTRNLEGQRCDYFQIVKSNLEMIDLPLIVITDNVRLKTYDIT